MVNSYQIWQQLSPLYKLLCANQRWHWGIEESQAFQKSKVLLMSEVLVHFDPKQELFLACDASAYGIGAVLAHRLPDGTEKRIGYISRTLTLVEKKYSQIEKEGLSCVFGVKRFHNNLYGHHFTLSTDHKPLLSLFNERKTKPSSISEDPTWGPDSGSL